MINYNLKGKKNNFPDDPDMEYFTCSYSDCINQHRS